MASFRDFLDYAESYKSSAENTNELGQDQKTQSSVIASILFSWIAIESFINNMMDDFTALPSDMFSLEEGALLTDRIVELATSGAQAGQFVLSKKIEYKPVEDKILFLIARFGKGNKVDKGADPWQSFMKVKEKRNQITHPRKELELSFALSDAEQALEIAKAIIRMVYSEVWKKSPDF